MLDEHDIEALLSLNGFSYEAVEGYVVEFKAECVAAPKPDPTSRAV